MRSETVPGVVSPSLPLLSCEATSLVYLPALALHFSLSSPVVSVSWQFLSIMNTRFEQLKLGLPLRWRLETHHQSPHLKYLQLRQTRRQGNEHQDESSSPSFSSLITKALINSPKMFRRTVTPGPASTEESPMSVRSNSPFQRRVTVRHRGLAGERSSTMSAPNTPSSRRVLLPRSHWHCLNRGVN